MASSARPTGRTIGEMYLEVAEALRGAFTRSAAAEGLTFMEGRALRLAATHPEQSHLNEALDTAPSQVSALLNKLERRGFVVRTASRGDRRHRSIRLTPDGEAALSRLEDHLEVHSPLLHALTDDERATLRTLLGKLLADAGR
jgi:DNA-binding MarR family transcriptional regulator